jgi:ELWxxDGT repeat protein
LRLVADLNPGQNSSGPTHFFVWGDHVWFLAFSDQDGKQLASIFCSDGTTAGTRRIKDFPLQTSGAFFENPFVFENRLYFQGPNAALGKGSRVWVTDGTEAGTRPISEDGKDVCDEYKPFLIGDRLVLSLHGNYDGHGLVALNLHTGVTETIAVPFDGWEDYTDGAMLNGVMLKLDLDGKVLWSIDGTHAGLKKLPLTGLPVFENDEGLNQFVSMPNGVLMLPNGRKQPFEFWRTDGRSLSKLPSWTWSKSHAHHIWLGAVGDLAVMIACDSSRRCGLWSSDGTAAGSQPIWDSDPYKDSTFSLPEGRHPTPVVAGGRLFFAMDDGQHGLELWCSDGTRKGTHLVLDIALGDEDAEIFKLYPVGGRVLFQRKNAASGTDVWITDGSESGSRKLATFNRATDVVAMLRGTILAVSENDQFGQELHALDVSE